MRVWESREKVRDQVREIERNLRVLSVFFFFFFNLRVLSVPMAVLSKRGCRTSFLKMEIPNWDGPI